ncbi:hypothetical protein RMSM_00757 [Rhodopirellula maiorica SM1]|uniref:Uncharacterized protein n=1 Tax=Rhodopirellula maiorica SM1 TaxID=1265738 RepID=M5RSQ7_9BACT|nr:hypothetical protein RMSM_00757 [Rhodopirellula maiorica SM1]
MTRVGYVEIASQIRIDGRPCPGRPIDLDQNVIPCHGCDVPMGTHHAISSCDLARDD